MKAPAPGHTPIFDDLASIRKRREELFPPARKYDVPLDTPVDPVVDRPPAAIEKQEEYYGCDWSTASGVYYATALAHLRRRS
jgi:hypothetical protein